MIKTLCSTILLAGLVALSSVRGAEPIPDSAKTGGFAIGCQAYTFNRFSLFEAIEKTAETGSKVIELYPGQKLSKEESNVKFDHNAPAEVIDKVKAKLKEHNILAVAYGVVGIPKDEGNARKVFEFAKNMGIRVINTESTDAIDTIEKLVKEYDLKVGYHNHPSKPNDPKYKVWDPNYILELVKDRDQRIGACADTGHWVRSGLKPVDCLKILKGRIVSSHLKDLHEFSRKGHDVPYGSGASDLKGILDEYKAQNFSGPISVEYEHNWENNVGEVKQCIDFVRTYGEKK
ncbi:MAG: sugar phosphate isomerase/epimerase [Verrucomicrobiaceae bacterium]|nr:MAG: sugar phosphate isomerase/epimerase [Verrucomicrobiaceae bacterium]